MRRANELKLMEHAGQISELKEQVVFVLLPNQYQDGKLIERKVSYVADFTYLDANGKYVCEDVKGFCTPDYVLKRKMLLALKGIRILETGLRSSRKSRNTSTK
jgi:hypothetical protein